MREVDLGNGLSVKVQVKHTDNEEINYGDVTVVGLRGTRVHATFTEKLPFTNNIQSREFYTKAVCGPKDNFCKAAGRKVAANRLMKELRDRTELTKTERAQVFATICPEYFS
jgi:hypothetical protein